MLDLSGRRILPQRFRRLVLGLASQTFKELGFRRDNFDCLGAHAPVQTSQKIAEIDSVCEIDSPVSHGLVFCVLGKATCRDEQALICLADHRSSEVSNLWCTDRAGVLLALKADMKDESWRIAADELLAFLKVAEQQWLMADE